jgi:hypothetical protein
MERMWSAKRGWIFNHMFYIVFFAILWRFKSSPRHHIETPSQTKESQKALFFYSAFCVFAVHLVQILLNKQH